MVRHIQAHFAPICIEGRSSFSLLARHGHFVGTSMTTYGYRDDNLCFQSQHPSSTELRIQKARTALLLDHPFFGSLLFRLKGRECRSIPTMATDGVSLYYNPEFVDTLNSATLAGVLAHEVMHPALHHHVRRSGRDSGRWNEACDYAINPLLLDAGLSLPEGILIDNRFREMSAEQICRQPRQAPSILPNTGRMEIRRP
jgi:Putative metallopeptidase domain